MTIPLILSFSLRNCFIFSPDIFLLSANSFSLYRFILFFYFYKESILVCAMYICQIRRVTRGGGGEVSPALFQKLEKSALIWRKNALIVVIYGYNFSFKMKFLRVSRGKTRRFFPARPFFRICR